MISVYSKQPIKNIYKKPNTRSELTSQIIYGEKLRILSRKKNWLKVKTLSDNYIGFIKKDNLTHKHFITHKTHLLKTKIYNNKKILIGYLPFNSRFAIVDKKNGYGKFDKGKWIRLKEIRKKDFKENNFIKIVKLFLKCRYLWGGKTYKGIDCSAIIQLIYLFNNKYFPRDTKDQIRYSKIKFSKNQFKKGSIIYWKGHVAICINKQKLIHAYGPKKKVLIMDIKKTIKLIDRTANLKVKKISII